MQTGHHQTTIQVEKIPGIQTRLRNGDAVPAEKNAEFFIAFALRLLGVDRELPPSHPYCSSNLNRILFSLA